MSNATLRINEGLDELRLNDYDLSECGADTRDIKEVVLEAVKEKGSSLEYASPRLKNDKDVVLESLKVSGWALEFASERLKDDKDVVLEAVKSFV